MFWEELLRYKYRDRLQEGPAELAGLPRVCYGLIEQVV